MLQWLPWENSDIIPGQGGRRENKARAAESRAFFPACLLPSSLSTPQEPCYVFFADAPFFWGKSSSNFFPREKEAVAFFTTGSRKVKYRYETERKSKVFRGAQHLLAPKNFIFFLQWYFTFRGSVVIKAAHRRKFSISASALPFFGRLPHSRREIFRFWEVYLQRRIIYIMLSRI